MAKAVTGQDPQTILAPGLSALQLALYALATAAVAWVALTRRDVA